MNGRRPWSLVTAAGGACLWLLENIGAAILIFMTALITVEVVGRTIFGQSTGFTYEMIGALTGCLGFVGLASTFLKGDHVRIVAFVSRAPRRAQHGLDVVAHALALGYGGLLTLYSGRQALHSVRAGERSWAAVPFPIYPFKVLLFIGMLAFTVALAVKVARLIAGRSGADRPASPGEA